MTPDFPYYPPALWEALNPSRLRRAPSPRSQFLFFSFPNHQTFGSPKHRPNPPHLSSASEERPRELLF